MTPFTPTHLATIGPEDYRKEVPVVVIRESGHPAFRMVMDADGNTLIVHVLKLKPLEEAETP